MKRILLAILILAIFLCGAFAQQPPKPEAKPTTTAESKPDAKPALALTAEEQKEVLDLQQEIDRAQSDLEKAQLKLDNLVAKQSIAILRAANRRGLNSDTHGLTGDNGHLKFVEKPKPDAAATVANGSTTPAAKPDRP